MTDYISREAAINACWNGWGLDTETSKHIEKNINAICSDDVAPVRHGKWIEHKNAEEAYGFLISNYECTCCHDWLRDMTRYCPSCGADMRPTLMSLTKAVDG